MKRSSASKTIVLLEDSSDDEILLRRALIQAGVKNRLIVFREARKALPWLKEVDSVGIVILDLCMPSMDGLDLLGWIRGQPNLESALLLVLTGSEGPHSVKQAYAMGANSFLTKPL